MSDLTELIERLRKEYSPTGDSIMGLCHDAADAIETLLEKQDNDDMIIDAANKRIEYLEDKYIHHTNRLQIANLTNHNIELKTRVEELEEKAEFNERWISQTCETGQIKAERNQNIATDAAWILTVSPLPEPPE